MNQSPQKPAHETAQTAEAAPPAASAVIPLNAIAAALAKAQSEMKNPALDAKNPHWGNRYASLASVRDAVIPPLTRNGIAVNQDVVTVDKGVALTLILTHSSGQQMRFGPLVFPLAKADAQGIIGGSTYGKRCQLQSVFCVVGEIDDDGEAATAPPKIEKPATPKPAASLGSATGSGASKAAPVSELDKLRAMIAAAKIDEGKVRVFLESKSAWPKGCASVAALPAKVLHRLIVPEVFAEIVAMQEGVTP